MPGPGRQHTQGATLDPISLPIDSSCYSDRSGKPKIIVLHSTEGSNEGGTGDLHTLRDILAGRGLSVHAGNDAEGNCARYVDDEKKAFHCSDYNDVALGLEQIGFASQNSWPAAQTDNAAKWIAYWAKKYNIPLTRSTNHGVCFHSDLGAAGGGHSDPGQGYPFEEVLRKASQYSGITIGDAGGGGGGSTGGDLGSFSEEDLFAIGRASAISTSLELPGLMSLAESHFMRGAKSIYNDEPLFSFVDELCQASLRQFQSLPNGAFFAFFADQFGLYGHRKAYWNIDNIEIIDGDIDLNDEALATHVFVVGDTNFTGSIDLFDRQLSKGVVTIYDAFTSDWLIDRGETAEEKVSKKVLDKENLESIAEADSFLRRYGRRPYYKDAAFIRNPFFEIFYAYTQWQILWSNQFRTQFTFTFMPELYPGGRVAFEEHGFQCFVDEVTHSFDYESGFTTTANLSAPSALKGGDPSISQGMVKPFLKKGKKPSGKD